MQMKTTYVLLATLTLTACGNREAGRSEYFDTVDAPNAQRAVVMPQSINPVTLSELQESMDGRDPSPLTGDAALVQSLNTAIERAGLTGRPIPVSNAPVQVATAPTIAIPVAQAPAIPSVATTALPATPNAGTSAGSSEITDNSFTTVAATETIETDRAKLETLQQQRVELQAEPLPERGGNVNLAAFARSTNHKIGTKMYPRGGLRSRAAAQCQKFRNPDEAQRAFLSEGGPQKDTMRMDPDGDGFVCGWSPVPFRSLQLPG